MRPDRVLSMLGIAMKAGAVVSGETATEIAVKNYEAYLVILACDASKNTIKHFTDMCTYRDIPLVTYATKSELGAAIGKEYRSNMAITDEKLAQAIRDKIDGIQH